MCDYQSPSSRGRGLKWNTQVVIIYDNTVALFTRAWIEILYQSFLMCDYQVALFTRAWIEISVIAAPVTVRIVALFTRAWIEMG